MPNRNNLFSKKYKKSQKKNFYLFGRFPICKSEFYFSIDRTLHISHFKRLSLPSYFKLVLDQDVQGPMLHIIYSSNLNFVKLKKIYNFKKSYGLHLSHFKLSQVWYAYNLLNDLKPYETSFSLCTYVIDYLKRSNVDFCRSHKP